MKLYVLAIFICLGIQTYGQNPMFDVCPIKTSEEIPESEVFNIEGEKLNLKEYIGDKPTVLVFYRGGWCGYCNKQLSELQENGEKISNLGYNIIAVSPDDFIRAEVEEGDRDETSIEILSDKDANAISDFGIAWKVDDEKFEKYKKDYDIDLEWWSNSDHHLLPVPAVFIIKDGKIEYQHVDPEYSNRLSPEMILAMLASIK